MGLAPPNNARTPKRGWQISPWRWSAHHPDHRLGSPTSGVELHQPGGAQRWTSNKRFAHRIPTHHGFADKQRCRPSAVAQRTHQGSAAVFASTRCESESCFHPTPTPALPGAHRAIVSLPPIRNPLSTAGRGSTRQRTHRLAETFACSFVTFQQRTNRVRIGHRTTRRTSSPPDRRLSRDPQRILLRAVHGSRNLRGRGPTGAQLTNFSTLNATRPHTRKRRDEV